MDRADGKTACKHMLSTDQITRKGDALRSATHKKFPKSVDYLLAGVVGVCMCTFLIFAGLVMMGVWVKMPWWLFGLAAVGLVAWLKAASS